MSDTFWRVYEVTYYTSDDPEDFTTDIASVTVEEYEGEDPDPRSDADSYMACAMEAAFVVASVVDKRGIPLVNGVEFSGSL